jgi:hypothetical protein
MTRATDNRYFSYPIHGTKSTKTSGTSMEVILGPEAVETTNYGSKTNSDSISSRMRPLNDKDYLVSSSGKKSGLWVAGHLLNDNLGGSGTSGENLTPLTQTANKQHAGYEGKIKRALESSAQILRNNTKVPFVVGVHYKVEVSDDAFGDFTPYNKAPSHITITANLVKVCKTTREITPLGIVDWPHIPPQQTIFLKPAVFKATIDNSDAHLSECKNGNCMHV